MAERCEKHKRVDVGTNKLERHHWRMGLAACRKVSSSAFRLAVVIEDHMNERSGEAWPDQETLSRRAAMSARQVREHLTALVGAGWLNALSGKDRTRPKTRRGLHYRPTWPDQATKDRCLIREYATTMEPVNTGGNPPVLNQNETGNLASQKRKSGASIPAEKRRNTGENPPLSYEATYEVTYTGRGSSRVPEVLDNSSISGGAAFAGASGSPIGDREQDYSFADLQEIERRDEAFATGPLPPFDGQETPPLVSHDEAEHQSFVDEDEFVADDDDFIGEDEEGGIPYDAKSADRPEAQSADPHDTTSDLLSRCFRREPELAADERLRLHVILASFRGGQPIADADLDALTVILARLEGGDEFADDLSEIDPDLSEPTTATAAATEIWRQ